MCGSKPLTGVRQLTTASPGPVAGNRGHDAGRAPAVAGDGRHRRCSRGAPPGVRRIKAEPPRPVTGTSARLATPDVHTSRLALS
jgi:hypothetical protein